MNPSFGEINATRALADPDSVLHHYRRLIALRHDEPAVAHGDFSRLLADHEQVYAFVRRHGDTELLVLANLESTARNPTTRSSWNRLVATAQLLCTLATERRRSGVSQTKVAAVMGTSQSAVSALEKTAADAKVSTLEKYAGALGYSVQYHLIPSQQAGTRPSVVFHDRSLQA